MSAMASSIRLWASGSQFSIFRAASSERPHKQQLRHPPADDGHGIFVFAQDAHEFQHHHAGGFGGQIWIVDAATYHAGSMTLLNRKSAASSPRPRRLKRSK